MACHHSRPPLRFRGRHSHAMKKVVKKARPPRTDQRTASVRKSPPPELSPTTAVNTIDSTPQSTTKKQRPQLDPDPPAPAHPLTERLVHGNANRARTPHRPPCHDYVVAQQQQKHSSDSRDVRSGSRVGGEGSGWKKGKKNQPPPPPSSTASRSIARPRACRDAPAAQCHATSATPTALRCASDTAPSHNTHGREQPRTLPTGASR